MDGLSLEVHAGEIFGLLGPNGAGKSTTVHPAMGRRGPSARRGMADLNRLAVEAPVHAFRVERPTLEQVFLRLTGRQLRD